ncbi:DUF1616 domain-containing protein [Halogeometricum limi]|uniref:Uncharacterized membrane protein n=1 Tax=Halogeometricum limi TaxID=555875 RepID=A0A1I6IJW8_9EURY|nr:DUF1616 domain-containing protein [Halogeometricum limi]SFR67067.1 Uncharacterized membrane protein [Halogeometricum limi]
MPRRTVSAVDLLVVVGFTAFTAMLVFAPPVDSPPLRAFCGAVFVLFVPGYALLAVLFPERISSDRVRLADDIRLSIRRGLTDLERAVLSFGTSLALAVLVGLLVDVSPWRLGLVPVFAGLGSLTVLFALGAVVRRRRTAASRRFDPDLFRGLRTGASAWLRPSSGTEVVLNVLLVLAVLLAGYSFVAPQEPTEFTEFYLLSEQNGTLSGQEFETELVNGEPQTYVVGVGNHEGQRETYTVVVTLQSDEASGTTPVERRELDRFEVAVGANQTEHTRHTVEPTVTGEGLRLTYLLYRETVPPNPSPANAYRELHLLVNVTEPTTEDDASNSFDGAWPDVDARSGDSIVESGLASRT